MKKKIVAFMLCALTVVPMAACGGKTPKEPQKNIELSRLVNGFETLGGYYSFEANYGFGAVRQNTDAAFVTEGSASLLLDVSGDFRDGSEKPSIGIALSENGSAVDLKKLKSLTFDMFNQTEEEQTVEISLTVDGVEVGKTEQKLAVGKNSIRYAPETRGLSVSGDLTKGESVNMAQAHGGFTWTIWCLTKTFASARLWLWIWTKTNFVRSIKIGKPILTAPKR